MVSATTPALADLSSHRPHGRATLCRDIGPDGCSIAIVSLASFLIQRNARMTAAR